MLAMQATIALKRNRHKSAAKFTHSQVNLSKNKENTAINQSTKSITEALRYVSSSGVMGTGNVLMSLNSGVLVLCTISVS